jgi:hypothetical protein
MADPEPRMHDLGAEINRATEACEKAMIAYREGRASCSAVNKADRELADLHLRLREVSGGRVRDYRY